MESIQTSDPNDIRDMMNSMPVTTDQEMLKSFLYALGGAVSSFRYKCYNNQSEITRKDISEITVLFDNFHGNLSYGIFPDIGSDINVEPQKRNFFPMFFATLPYQLYLERSCGDLASL